MVIEAKSSGIKPSKLNWNDFLTLLNGMIMLSSSWDIGDLVSSDLVTTNWSADNLVNTDCFKMFLVPFERSS